MSEDQYKVRIQILRLALQLVAPLLDEPFRLKVEAVLEGDAKHDEVASV